MNRAQRDLVIVGGGIVGLATALSAHETHPQLSITLLEKEPEVAQHQTGHNSGVLHAGVYYKPGSLRAKLCTQGKLRMERFCEENDIPFERCGKVIVAFSQDELPRLKTIFERGQANAVPGLAWIETGLLREIEPHCGGIAAVHSPFTGIVDYKQVAATMKKLLLQRGVEVRTTSKAQALRETPHGVELDTQSGDFSAKHIITCGGLFADVLARKMGAASDAQIVPFRGEYYFLKPERQHLVKGLIYPVPDPRFPFLGVHFTKTIHGSVEAGPNAVFALAREGYSWGNLHLPELAEALGFAGFRKLASKHWRMGLMEMRRSLSQHLFVDTLRRLVPEIRDKDVVPGGAGVRAQAINRNGELVDDFSFIEMPRALHVINAPSPAATASLSIGQYIVNRAGDLFGWGAP